MMERVIIKAEPPISLSSSVDNKSLSEAFLNKIKDTGLFDEFRKECLEELMQSVCNNLISSPFFRLNFYLCVSFFTNSAICYSYAIVFGGIFATTWSEPLPIHDDVAS